MINGISKRGLLIVGTLVFGIFSLAMQTQQTAGELFEKALYAEEAQGDLQKAIGLYQQILDRFPDERETAAKAQLQIGLCLQKLGNDEAEKAFQKVIDDYPDQGEAVRQAQEKLSRLSRSRTVMETGDRDLSIRQVWTGPGVDSLGAVSPDGRFLSFVDWMTGDLAIRELATGKNRRLTDKGSWMESPEMALFSKWSPDGRRIAYCWINKEKGIELHVVNVDEPKPQVLYQKKMAYVQPMDWTPDGKHILAILIGENEELRSLGREADGRLALGLVSAEDGTLRILKRFEIAVNDGPYSFTYSPDGRFIAYDCPQKEVIANRDIFLLSADGSLNVPLVDHPALDYVLGWAPDGTGLVFVSERSGSRSVWTIDVEDGKPFGPARLIKSDIGPAQSMGLTSQGALFFGIANNVSDVYVIGIDAASGKIVDKAEKAVSHYEGNNAFPDYSPDGKSLAYMSLRNSRPNQGRNFPNVLCILSFETGGVRELTLDLAGYDYPRWSRDGRSISVEGRDWEGRQGIFRVDAQTGDLTPLVLCESGKVIYSHRWSRDGKSLLYASGDDDLRERKDGSAGTSHVFVLDIESRESRVLPGSPADATDIDLSPDGQWLAILNRGNERVIRTLPAAGGEPREVYRFKQTGNHVISPAWSADSRYILFSKIPPSPDEMWELYSISRDGGDPRKFDISMNQFRHFSLHPDGRHIVFSSRGTRSGFAEIWVMENFLPAKVK